MKITACMSLVAEQYRASDALVLPVDAQAARLAPTNRAWLKAADIPLSLKLPDGFIPSYRRVHPFVLQEQTPGSAADVSGNAFGRLQQRLAFAYGDALFLRHKRQQFMEPPYAAETERIGPPRPFLLEFGERLGGRRFIPLVDHIDQVAAFGAIDADFVD
jgi:hypothetical protein